MDRRRGEDKNWYTLPIEERQRQMEEHGMVGRRYAGKVQQIITGSIGFDDWEWGVDLFADDPLIFKRLIYEMRFDEVSAVYALFGQFFRGRANSGAQDLRLDEWELTQAVLLRIQPISYADRSCGWPAGSRFPCEPRSRIRFPRARRTPFLLEEER